jgi:hypothetical protein
MAKVKKAKAEATEVSKAVEGAGEKIMCVFNESRKVGGVIYPKSKKPVAVEKKHLDHWFTKALIKQGDILTAMPVEEDEADDESEESEE